MAVAEESTVAKRKKIYFSVAVKAVLGQCSALNLLII